MCKHYVFYVTFFSIYFLAVRLYCCCFGCVAKKISRIKNRLLMVWESFYDRFGDIVLCAFVCENFRWVHTQQDANGSTVMMMRKATSWKFLIKWFLDCWIKLNYELNYWHVLFNCVKLNHGTNKFINNIRSFWVLSILFINCLQIYIHYFPCVW